VSGWSDGKIRAFGPQTGKLLYVINDAHKVSGMKRVSGNLTGVTALAVSNDSSRLISGGADSQVRVWHIGQESQVMVASMKEHKATVNDIALREGDTHAVTASDDGSCIVWDLTRMVRANIMYAQTYFRAVSYYTDESQILTTGSDRKITYWDSYECSAIRELEGAKSGEVNTLDINADGERFVSGGADKILKVWNYGLGTVEAIGLGHSGNITKARFSPDGDSIISVGDEGGIFVWEVPHGDLANGHASD
jgi:WD40 repeat protein